MNLFIKFFNKMQPIFSHTLKLYLLDTYHISEKSVRLLSLTPKPSPSLPPPSSSVPLPSSSVPPPFSLLLVFDRTVFHPQGGGQPSDKGRIFFKNKAFSIIDVIYDKEKELIYHKIEAFEGWQDFFGWKEVKEEECKREEGRKEEGRGREEQSNEGERKGEGNSEEKRGKEGEEKEDEGRREGEGREVSGERENKGEDLLFDLEVEKERRVMNARLHSAGHLIDFGVKKAGLDWVAGKGYHFEDSPYVEYIGKPVTDMEAIRKKIELECNILIQQEKSSSQFLFLDPSSPLPPPPFLSSSPPSSFSPSPSSSFPSPPSYASLLLPKTLRWVRLFDGDEGCPCGGTHVRSVKEITGVEITKITKKGKNVRVSYKLKDGVEKMI